MSVGIVGIMATGRSDLISVLPKVMGLFTEKVNFDSLGKTCTAHSKTSQGDTMQIVHGVL